MMVVIARMTSPLPQMMSICRIRIQDIFWFFFQWNDDRSPLWCGFFYLLDDDDDRYVDGQQKLIWYL